MKRLLQTLGVVTLVAAGLGTSWAVAGDRDQCKYCHTSTTITVTEPGETVTVTEPGGTTTVTEPGQTVTVTTPGPERVRTVTQTVTEPAVTVTTPPVTVVETAPAETVVQTETVVKTQDGDEGEVAHQDQVEDAHRDPEGVQEAASALLSGERLASSSRRPVVPPPGRRAPMPRSACRSHCSRPSRVA